MHMAARKTKAKTAVKAAKKKTAVKKIAAKKSAPMKIVKLRPKKIAAKKNGNGGPKPSTLPWGKAGKALDGVKILDFTHVQSGPTCTQLLAYMGADCIKIERPGVGDITRTQLRDVKGADSLYFTMLNANKRSITIDSKHPKGKEILERLVKTCDVLVENFAPGALDRMGFTWEYVHKLNPRIVMASVKGFGPGPYEECKVYENIAQCAGGAASTTGFREGPPLDGREDRFKPRQPRVGRGVVGIGLPFGLADEVADRLPDRRLGDEVDIGVGVFRRALTLENPARLAATGIVAGARHRITEGHAFAVLAVFGERAVLETLLVAQFYAREIQHSVLHRAKYALAAAGTHALIKRADESEREVQARP